MSDELMHLSYSEVVAVLNEQAARIAELERELGEARVYTRQDRIDRALDRMGGKHDAKDAAAPRPVSEWMPVEDGNFVPTITYGELWVYARDGKPGKTLVFQRDSFHGDIILVDGYAICKRVAAPQTKENSDER